MNTQEKILAKAVKIFAREGAAGLSMRKLALETGIAASVIYHHYQNKEKLMQQIFIQISSRLGVLRRALPKVDSVDALLKQRIEFQIDHAEEVVAVLKYYLANRKMFIKTETGFVPDNAYLHIEEVLLRGIESGDFIQMDVKAEAKVIAHAINGFLLEYYPYKPTSSEKQQLVDNLYRFVIRSIKKK